MTSLSATLLFAQGSQQSNPMSFFLIFALMIGGMYFLTIAPQRKRQKEHDAMVKGLKAGDEVMTASGIYGKINTVKEDRIVVTIGEGTKVEMNPSYVQQKIVRDKPKT